MHKYEPQIQRNTGVDEGDRRSPGRRLLDSAFAKFLRLLSVLLGVYAPMAMLFGVLLIMTPFGQYSDDEEEFKSQRRQFATAALLMIGTGAVGAYGSYRVWGLAANIRRNNRRRAKGLD